MRFVRRDGSLLWVEVHANPLHHDDGHALRRGRLLRRRDRARGAGPAHAPRGRHRRADRAREPARAGADAGRGAGAGGRAGALGRRGDARPRRLQGDQRHARARGGRRGAARGRAPAAALRARARPRGAARRRRVRGRADRPRRALGRGRRTRWTASATALAAPFDDAWSSAWARRSAWPRSRPTAATRPTCSRTPTAAMYARQGRAQRLAAIASPARRCDDPVDPDLRHVRRARLARAVPRDPLHARRVRGRGAAGGRRGRRDGPPPRAHAGRDAVARDRGLPRDHRRDPRRGRRRA